MKIIILLMLAYFVSVLACNPAPVTPTYKTGRYKLVQKYLYSEIVGSITFYSQNEFYTTIATTRHNYVYSKVNAAQIKADCTDCNATYVFTVSNITANSETWKANLGGSFLQWELSK